MPIGLICAIPQELGHLRRDLTGIRNEVRGQIGFDCGTLDDCEVVIAGSGMGKVNAATVATLLADRFGCRTIVFSGVAGGLDPALSIGDVVIADRVIHHDAGVIDADGLQTYQPGHVPFINPTERFGYPVDPQLLVRVKDRLGGMSLARLSSAAGGGERAPQIEYGTILSGDQFLHSESTRVRLHEEFGGLAVEMEGGAVAQTCETFGLPWLVIRALSDLAGRGSPMDFTTYVEEVAASSAAILRRILPVL
jgi:adenosylhomocysteine nucleosidase